MLQEAAIVEKMNYKEEKFDIIIVTH